VLEAGSLAARAYGQPIVLERIGIGTDSQLVPRVLAARGMTFTGCRRRTLVEIVEIADHPFIRRSFTRIQNRRRTVDPLFARHRFGTRLRGANGRAEASAPMLQERADEAFLDRPSTTRSRRGRLGVIDGVTTNPTLIGRPDRPRTRSSASGGPSMADTTCPRRKDVREAASR